MLDVSVRCTENRRVQKRQFSTPLFMAVGTHAQSKSGTAAADLKVSSYVTEQIICEILIKCVNVLKLER